MNQQKTKIIVCVHSLEGICKDCMTADSGAVPTFKIIEVEKKSEDPQCKKCLLLKANCEYHKI